MSRAPKWHGERRLKVPYTVFYGNTDRLLRKWRLQKVHGYHLQTARLCRDKQQTQISAYTQVKKWEDATGRYWKISRVRMSRYLDTSYQSTKWQKNHGTVMEGPSCFLLSGNLLRSFFWQGPLWERQFEKSFFFFYGWEKSFQIGTACFVDRGKRDYSCLCTWDDIKTGRQDRKT